MIKVVYGPKGTGKTKIIIDEANSKVAGAKGHLIFITNTKRYMYDLHRDIRVIDTNDFMVAGEEALIGFVKGVVAANNDNEYLFIDGAARIAGKPMGADEWFLVPDDEDEIDVVNYDYFDKEDAARK